MLRTSDSRSAHAHELLSSLSMSATLPPPVTDQRSYGLDKAHDPYQDPLRCSAREAWSQTVCNILRVADLLEHPTSTDRTPSSSFPVGKSPSTTQAPSMTSTNNIATLDSWRTNYQVIEWLTVFWKTV